MNIVEGMLPSSLNRSASEDAPLLAPVTSLQSPITNLKSPITLVSFIFRHNIAYNIVRSA